VAGVEQLLKTIIEAAVEMGAIKRTEFERVIVDTTVQEKAVAHPSDSRLLEVARARIAQLATRAGIKLKQSYATEGQQLRRRAGGYAHARSSSGCAACCGASASSWAVCCATWSARSPTKPKQA